MQVLVADDDPQSLRLLEAVLTRAGHDVQTCADGAAALDALRDGIRLAILDWEMPGYNGLEVCRALQAQQATRPVYAIILTAKDWHQSMDLALDAGASDFIAKPFRTEDLLARVRIGERAVRMQAQLASAESQKLESIGRLAAGIAHEINTPTQYVGDNIRFLDDAFGNVVEVLGLYAELLALAREDQAPPTLWQQLHAALERSDMDFLFAEIPLAISNSLEGVAKISRIVRAMKDFSHPDAEEKTPIDLNRALESTLEVSRNEWKYVAQVVTDFDPQLPLVNCLPGVLNQAFLNLFINAAHAIADALGDSGGKGTITVSTRRAGRWAEVRISDTGAGIPAAIRNKIFDPFFTTKELGKGTGQGLPITRSAVVEKHNGELTFDSVEGRGTVFTIRIPMDAFETHPPLTVAGSIPPEGSER